MAEEHTGHLLKRQDNKRLGQNQNPGPDLEGPGGPTPQASHQTAQFLKPRNSIANPGLHNFCYHLCIVK